MEVLKPAWSLLILSLVHSDQKLEKGNWESAKSLRNKWEMRTCPKYTVPQVGGKTAEPLYNGQLL